MSQPPQVPIQIWRGNNRPYVQWGFGPASAPTDLTGSVFHLEIAWPAIASPPDQTAPAGTLTATSEAGGTLVIDLVAGTVTWDLTLADSNAIPRFAKPTYELKRLIGGEVRTWVWGPVKVLSAAGG